MDWSTIFDEAGDEIGDWDRLLVTNRLDPVIEIAESQGRYNKTVMYTFTINYVLGVGFLGIPYAFERVGLLLGTVITIFTSLVCYVTVMYVAEAAHRGMQLIEDSGKDQFPTWITTLKAKKSRRHGNSSADVTPVSGQSASIEYSSMDEILKKTSIFVPMSPGPSVEALPRLRADTFQSDTDATISGLEPEVVDLAYAFLGPLGKVIYQCALVGLTFSGTFLYIYIYIYIYKLNFIDILSCARATCICSGLPTDNYFSGSSEGIADLRSDHFWCNRSATFVF
jgi:hypothetical protein